MDRPIGIQRGGAARRCAVDGWVAYTAVDFLFTDLPAALSFLAPAPAPTSLTEAKREEAGPAGPLRVLWTVSIGRGKVERGQRETRGG